MLRAENLSKSYGGHRALRNVSISVQPGTITALIGANGSGKTSLLNHLAMVEKPDDGEVTLCGVSAREMPRGPLSQTVWPRVTAVFQQLFLWPHLTVRDNLTLACRRLSIDGWEPRLDSLSGRFALRPLLSRFPNQISLGERQRTAVVRALLLQPDYLLLDEVTSALDMQQMAVLLEHLRLLRDTGTAVLFVTHLLGFVRNSADHVVFLHEGTVAEEGDASLLTTPTTPDLKALLDLWD